MSLNLLIVDDSSTIRKILRRSISQAGITFENIYEAGDGVQALGVLESSAVNVVMTDINMPQMGGLQLLSEIKKRPQWNGIPVIIITTESGLEAVSEAAQHGVAGYIRKPFTPEEIQAHLQPVVTALAG